MQKPTEKKCISRLLNSVPLPAGQAGPCDAVFIGFVLLTFQLLFFNNCNAQSPLSLNIEQALSQISQQPQVVHLKSNGINVPTGGHLQGIQCLSDSLLLITASSGSYSYYLTAQLNHKAGTGQLKAIHKITDRPFRHAGGGQVYGHKMVVGVEDNHARNKSDIIVLSLDNAGNETGRHIIAHRQGVVKRSTAGAVGFTKTKTGQYMVIVGDWDSDIFDIYLSRRGADSVFDSLTTFRAPDNKLPSYQAINLLTDTAGHIYMIGLYRSGLKNIAKMYQLNFGTDGPHALFVSSNQYNCKGGASFRYASGIDVINNHQLHIYSCGRGTRPGTTVNIFEGQ